LLQLLIPPSENEVEKLKKAKKLTKRQGFVMFESYFRRVQPKNGHPITKQKHTKTLYFPS